jgi:mono/diheme cytochrome c family protein
VSFDKHVVDLEEISMRRLAFLFTIAMVLVLLMTACGGGDDSSSEPTDAPAASQGDAVAGEPLFQSTCAACHGPDAKGLPNLGKDMTTSTFIASNSDDELLAFVKTGRPVSDPDNTTGVDMPPKGGNPALTDEQLLDIIAYIRTVQE